MNAIYLESPASNEVPIQGRTIMVLDCGLPEGTAVWLSVYCNLSDEDSGIDIRFDLDTVQWLIREFDQVQRHMDRGEEYEAILTVEHSDPCQCGNTHERAYP